MVQSNKEVVEASELEWAVGAPAPATFYHNGRLFKMVATSEDNEGEIQAWIYREALGIGCDITQVTYLHVLND